MTDATPVPSFSLRREPAELRFRRVVLDARERIAPDYVRVTLRGPELAGFGGGGHDDHIRVFFPATEPAPGTTPSVDELRAAPSRELTPLWWDDESLVLEFVVHGDAGVAGVWADRAPEGSLVGIGGPRGSLHVEGTPDAWVLAGDESAVAQLRRYAALVPAGAPARILVEVADAAHEIPIDTAVPVEYVHRDGTAPGTALAARLDALGAEDRPAGDPFVFVAAEHGVVRSARALAVDRWGLDADRIVVKGYWRHDA